MVATSLRAGMIRSQRIQRSRPRVVPRSSRNASPKGHNRILQPLLPPGSRFKVAIERTVQSAFRWCGAAHFGRTGKLVPWNRVGFLCPEDYDMISDI